MTTATGWSKHPLFVFAASRRSSRPQVTRPREGTVVIDVGREINGWLRIDDLGPRDTHLTLTHGEVLDGDGLVSMENLRAFVFSTGERLPAGQVDEVISAGRTGDVFEPRHTTHGFRYRADRWRSRGVGCLRCARRRRAQRPPTRR